MILTHTACLAKQGTTHTSSLIPLMTSQNEASLKGMYSGWQMMWR